MDAVKNAYNLYADQVAADKSNPILAYAKDYCDNFEKTISKKLSILNTLKTYDYNTNEFID